VIDIPSKEESEKLAEDLKQKGFDIFTVTQEKIEAKFTQEYMMVVDMRRELDREGWVFREMGKVIIDIPGFRKTLPD
jgi:hypothetical protein